MSRRRGVLYVSVLMLTMMLLVLGMAFLSGQGPEAQRGRDAEDAAQAQELARAGIEDARIKLANDIEFPPVGVDQLVFSYTELVDGLGSFRVHIDSANRRKPHYLYALVSEGFVGPATKPRARARILAWIDTRTVEVVRWDE